MSRNAPRRLALALAIAATVLASAAPSHSQGIHAGEGTTAAAFPYTDAETRHARIDSLHGKQRLAGAALIGIGVPGGIMLARSRNG